MINKILGDITYFYTERDDATAGNIKRLSDWCLTAKGWMPRPQRWASYSYTNDSMVDVSFTHIKPWTDAFGMDSKFANPIRLHEFNEMPMKYTRTESL